MELEFSGEVEGNGLLATHAEGVEQLAEDAVSPIVHKTIIEL